MRHLIHRQILEVTFAGREQAQRWSPRLTELNQQVILPELERVFAELAGDGTLRLERLEIDLGSLRPDQLGSELSGRLRQQATAALQAQLLVPPAVASSDIAPPHRQRVEIDSLGAADLEELFATFLQTGQFPWWLDRESSSRLDGLFRRFWEIAPEPARTLLLQTLADFPRRRRYIEQFSNRSQSEALRRLIGPEAELLNDLRKLGQALLFRQFPREQARPFSYEALYLLLADSLRQPQLGRPELAGRYFTLLAEVCGSSRKRLLVSLDSEISRVRLSAPTREVLARLLHEDSSAQASVPQVRQRPPVSPVNREEDELRVLAAEREDCAFEALVDNAGLVLLRPHLAEIFRKLELLERPDERHERPQMAAVLLLQQLATGKPAGREPQLALNKLLCGMAQTVPVPRRRQRSKLWDAEVEALLAAVIGQWAALKNTSLHGFRSSFLQREGLLREEAHGWVLQVERKAYDLLLEQLPWGIGMIQFSWMPKPLRIEW